MLISVAAQSPSHFVCNKKIFSRICKWTKISRPLSGGSEGTHYRNWSFSTKKEIPALNLYSLLDQACHYTLHDTLKLYSCFIWPWISNAFFLSGSLFFSLFVVALCFLSSCKQECGLDGKNSSFESQMLLPVIWKFKIKEVVY